MRDRKFKPWKLVEKVGQGPKCEGIIPVTMGTVPISNSCRSVGGPTPVQSKVPFAHPFQASSLASTVEEISQTR